MAHSYKLKALTRVTADGAAGSAAFEDGKRVWEGWPYAEADLNPNPSPNPIPVQPRFSGSRRRT